MSRKSRAEDTVRQKGDRSNDCDGGREVCLAGLVGFQLVTSLRTSRRHACNPSPAVAWGELPGRVGRCMGQVTVAAATESRLPIDSS